MWDVGCVSVSEERAASIFGVTVPFAFWIVKNGAMLGYKNLVRQMLSDLLWEIIKWLEIKKKIFFFPK
jgi:hypothetical protein